MLLQSISIHNYRCFVDVVDLPLERITAFIGPNDSGKSSILLLLKHCFQNEPIPLADFNDQRNPITVGLDFQVGRAHEAEKAQTFMLSSNQLRVRKEFHPDKKPTTFVYNSCFKDSRLNQLDNLRVTDLTALIEELGIATKPRVKAECVTAISAHIAQHPPERDYGWIPIGSQLDHILPEYLMFGADEDLTLQTGPLVVTLRQVYRRFLQEENLDEVERLLGRAKAKLQEVVSQIEPSIQHFAGEGTGLVISPTLDLANSLNLGEVLVLSGTGEELRFSRCGDGTKRRIMLGLFHWSNDVLSKILEEEQRSILWGFDEPDTHLHYQAQYELLASIKRVAADRMQVLICTHSIPIIDRLSPKAVRQMLPDRGSRSTVIEYLRVDEAEDVEKFLKEVGQGVGFANSLLFYERCFILVEGPTEEKALPILYRTLYGAEFIEHGIRVFAAESDGSVLMLARLLHRNKKDVVVLLDRDTEGKLSTMLDKLDDCGFNVAERVIYIGACEFEDSFCNEALSLCLNTHYPRTDGAPWASKHVDPFRYNDGEQVVKKFSHDFLEVAVGQAAHKKVAKPEFGRKLAEQITEDRLIPREIKDLFRLVRAIAGIT